MLQPKRTKFRKQQKGRNRGMATRGNKVCFGKFLPQANVFLRSRHYITHVFECFQAPGPLQNCSSCPPDHFNFDLFFCGGCTHYLGGTNYLRSPVPRMESRCPLPITNASGRALTIILHSPSLPEPYEPTLIGGSKLEDTY